MPASTHKSFELLPDTEELTLRAAELGLEVRFEVMAEVDSTQSHLLTRKAPELRTGDVCVAHHQTKGRGRLSRTWDTRPGEGLMFSIVLRPPMVESVPLVAGVACVQALREWLPAVELKWPNDLVVALEAGHAKLGGMVASVHPDDPNLVVLGIGINCVFDGERPTAQAVALADFVETLPTRESVLLTIVRQIFHVFAMSRHDLESSYREMCGTVGQQVRVHRLAAEPMEGTAIDVSIAGLQVRDVAGNMHIFSSVDVEHLRTS